MSVLSALWRARLARTGVLMVGALIVIGTLAPYISPYDPHALSGSALTPPSGAHWLGTNDAGQDICSQLIWGARQSMAIAFPAAGLTAVLAVVFGIGGGLRGGWLEVASMRLVDTLLALPGLPLVLLLAALAGPNRLVVIGVIGFVGWPPLARIVRAQTLSLRQRGFVLAARGFGGSTPYLMRRHLVPAIAPTLLAGFVQWAALAVVLEAGLAFLGLGSSTGLSWGLMLSQALQQRALFLTDYWLWWVLPPAVAITWAVLGFTFAAVGVEPVFNPRWRRSL